MNTEQNIDSANLALKAGQRLRATASTPDCAMHYPDPQYLRGLLHIAGLSQRYATRLIGISERMMRYYLTYDKNELRSAPYMLQYTLEQLARQHMHDK